MRVGAADEEGAEKLGGGGRADLRTSALLGFLVTRSAAVGAGSAEIDARALRLGKAAAIGGARLGFVGACSRFALGRMN